MSFVDSTRCAGALLAQDSHRVKLVNLSFNL